jgi:ribosome-associated translation inhibitor RaiA
MIRIIFKNLDKSELAKDIVNERLQSTIDRFPDLRSHRLSVTLCMDNSPLKPGPDLFKVKLLITGKKYKNIVLEKSALSLYAALADVIEHTLERLNRFGDKERIKERTLARNFLKRELDDQKRDY